MKGAGSNAATSDGLSALHVAAHDGEVELLRLLLNAGANVNARSARGVTAIDMATGDACISLLRAHGGKPGSELR